VNAPSTLASPAPAALPNTGQTSHGLSALSDALARSPINSRHATIAPTNTPSGSANASSCTKNMTGRCPGTTTVSAKHKTSTAKPPAVG
jgi:hypothetical protein